MVYRAFWTWEEMLHSTKVIVLPPKLSRRTQVSLLSRYGMCAGHDGDEIFELIVFSRRITLASSMREQLIFCAYLSRIPYAPVWLTRYDPARSTKVKSDFFTLVWVSRKDDGSGIGVSVPCDYRILYCHFILSLSCPFMSFTYTNPYREVNSSPFLLNLLSLWSLLSLLDVSLRILASTLRGVRMLVLSSSLSSLLQSSLRSFTVASVYASSRITCSISTKNSVWARLLFTFSWVTPMCRSCSATCNKSNASSMLCTECLLSPCTSTPLELAATTVFLFPFYLFLLLLILLMLLMLVLIWGMMSSLSRVRIDKLVDLGTGVVILWFLLSLPWLLNTSLPLIPDDVVVVVVASDNVEFVR